MSVTPAADGLSTLVPTRPVKDKESFREGFLVGLTVVAKMGGATEDECKDLMIAMDSVLVSAFNSRASPYIFAAWSS